MYTTQTFQLHSFEQLLIFDSFRSSVQVEFQQKMMLELGMLEKDIQKLAEAEQRTEVWGILLVTQFLWSFPFEYRN